MIRCRAAGAAVAFYSRWLGQCRPMPDAACQSRSKRIPGGYTVNLSDDRKLWIYGRKAEIANRHMR